MTAFFAEIPERKFPAETFFQTFFAGTFKFGVVKTTRDVRGEFHFIESKVSLRSNKTLTYNTSLLQPHTMLLKLNLKLTSRHHRKLYELNFEAKFSMNESTVISRARCHPVVWAGTGAADDACGLNVSYL